jgi:hypothetical protein
VPTYFGSHGSTYRFALSSSQLSFLADKPVSQVPGILNLSCVIFSSASLFRHLWLAVLFGIRLTFHLRFFPFQQIDLSYIVLFCLYLPLGSEVASSTAQFIYSLLIPFQPHAPAFLLAL